MEILIVGLLAGAGILFAKRKQAQSDALTTTPRAQAPASGNGDGNAALSGLAKVPVVGGVVVATVGGVVIGTKLGKKLDVAVSGGSATPLTQTGGAIVGGTVVGGAIAVVGGGAVAFSAFGGLAALAAFGAIAGPLFLVLVGVAVAVYAIILFINDQEALSYGQAGAIRDYEKQWHEIYDRGHAQIRMTPAFASYTDVEIAMLLTPFVDGYMQELNRLSFQSWWRSPKGITELGLDTMGHLRFGRDRGKFVGDVTGINPDTAALAWNNGNHYDVYYDSDWIGHNLPMGTYQSQTLRRAIRINPSVGDVGPSPTGPARGARGPVTGYETYVLNSLDAATLAAMSKAYDKGRKFCNLMRYHDYMTKNPDGIDNPDVRLKVGLQKSLFEGSVGSGAGNLTWAGAEFNYAAINSELG